MTAIEETYFRLSWEAWTHKTSLGSACAKTITIIPKHIHLRPESQAHAPAHVLMSLYQIDKSLVFTKRKKNVILEYEIFNDPHDVKE